MTCPTCGYLAERLITATARLIGRYSWYECTKCGLKWIEAEIKH